MEILKSKVGPLKWVAIYQSGKSFLLSDEDINSNPFRFDLIKIISLKTLQGFTPTEFFQKEEQGIIV